MSRAPHLDGRGAVRGVTVDDQSCSRSGSEWLCPQLHRVAGARTCTRVPVDVSRPNKKKTEGKNAQYQKCQMPIAEKGQMPDAKCRGQCKLTVLGGPVRSVMHIPSLSAIWLRWWSGLKVNNWLVPSLQWYNWTPGPLKSYTSKHLSP